MPLNDPSSSSTTTPHIAATIVGTFAALALVIGLASFAWAVVLLIGWLRLYQLDPRHGEGAKLFLAMLFGLVALIASAIGFMGSKLAKRLASHGKNAVSNE